MDDPLQRLAAVLAGNNGGVLPEPSEFCGLGELQLSRGHLVDSVARRLGRDPGSFDPLDQVPDGVAAASGEKPLSLREVRREVAERRGARW